MAKKPHAEILCDGMDGICPEVFSAPHLDLKSFFKESQRTIQTLVFFGGLCQYGVCLNRRVGLFVLVMSGFCRVILCVTGMRMMMMSDEQVFTRC
jgi:hypothetical protein